jgi:asparagine synthase (glutamine-hydrolysing)
LTPYVGIRRLPGGHAIELKHDTWHLRRYWRPRYAEPPRLSRKEAVNAVRGELRRAVGKRVDPSHTGILLSGGLDSTSIAGVARRDLGERLHAYSAIFPAHAQSDESAILETITNHLDLPWTRLSARRASVIEDSLTYLREWRVPSAVPNLYFILPLLRTAARDGASVVLDGEGGDELFGCVEYAAADRLRHGDAAGAVRLIRQLPWDGEVQPWRATYHLLKRFGAKGVLPYGAHRVSRRVRHHARGGAPWLSVEARRSLADDRDPWAWKRADGPLWWAYLADLVTEGRVRLGIPDVLRRLGRMTGVDRRQPFLDDLDLIELVLAMPPELAFDPRHSRPLLREAVFGLVPDSVRLQTSKADFRALIEECFAGPERAVISSLILAPDSRIRPFILPAVAEDALAKVGQPRFNAYQAALLRMVTAECWLRSLDDPLFPERLLETSRLPSADVEVLAA